MLLGTLFGKFPFLQKLFADSAYQGPIFADGLTKILPCLQTEIVRRPALAPREMQPSVKLQIIML